MTIKSIIDALEPEDRRRLLHAFDNTFSQFVEYAPGKFIGVHIQNIPSLEIEIEVGDWSIGIIK